MLRYVMRLVASLAILFAWLLPSPPALADPADAVEGGPPPLHVLLVYLGKDYEEPEPLSLIDKILTDQGIQGARIAVGENNQTGRLIGQDFELREIIVPRTGDPVAEAKKIIAQGHKLIVADLEPEDLLAVADLPEARDAIILDTRSSDDELRQEKCRPNVFHIRPSWAMRADALAQYMLWKKWRRWLLITGKKPKDKAFAAAVRRSAARFGGKIVEEREYAFESGSRRTDTGHQQIQTQMPQLTQGAPEYDVAFVADVEESFGDYLLFRTYEPRPVAGTHGLVAVSWHRAFEEYAATQMQNRFERRAKRTMTERDYTAWLAVRIFGEVITRIATVKSDDVRKYLLSDEFAVAGFKGEGLTFRKWDLQLRQPILLAGPRALVSVSPQEGFLHPKFLTDTLGIDEPETKCRFNNS